MSYEERNMEGRCIVSGCGKAASKCCGSCGFVRYCSAECQKEDWKKHHKKLECVNMTKLSSVSLTEEEINAVVKKITNISDIQRCSIEPNNTIHNTLKLLYRNSLQCISPPYYVPHTTQCSCIRLNYCNV